MLNFFALMGMFLVVAYFNTGITFASAFVFAGGFLGASMFKKGR